MNYSLGGFRHEKKILVCLGTDVLLIAVSFPIFNIFLNNPAFYAVPMVACLSFSAMRRLLKNAADTNRTIQLNAVMLPGLCIITDAAFMGFDTFHFIQFIVLTVLLHILLSFRRKGAAVNEFQ
ncbi:MAG: hypothetical protein ACC608_01410 [Anaerofustis sp.]